MCKYFDIYIVGVGGQGILTVADVLTTAAEKKGFDVNYFPTKGMAQRGGFVKAQVRLGYVPNHFSPEISQGGADLIVSMERSETLKAIRYAKKGAKFVVMGLRWEPTAVMLGKAEYPENDVIFNEIEKIDGQVIYIDPEKVPEYARPNIFLLGAIMAKTDVSNLFTLEEIESVIAEKWPKVSELNLHAFREGFAFSDL